MNSTADDAKVQNSALGMARDILRVEGNLEKIYLTEILTPKANPKLRDQLAASGPEQ